MKNMPKGHGLLIAEKKLFMEDVRNVYKKYASQIPYTLDFECFAGHVVELPNPAEFNKEWEHWDMKNIPMIPDKWYYLKSSNDFKSKRYDSVINTLKSKKYDFIINAGDPEREGQLIQDAFFSTMDSNLKSIPIYRMWYNGISDEILFKSLNNLLLPEDNIPNLGTVENLSKASFLRARMDWLIGLNSTQILSLKSKSKISVGPVQTPILKIIVDKELSIKNFKVSTFWTIKSVFKHKNGEYIGSLLNEDGKLYQFDKKEEAEKVLNDIKSKNGAKIISKKVSNATELAPKLFSTGSLQGYASKTYGLSMSETDNALEMFWSKNIASYPRTDSDCITEEDAKDVQFYFNSIKSVPQLAGIEKPSNDEFEKFYKNKRFVNNKEVRGHSAITPLPDTVVDFKQLTKSQQDVYYLICRSIVLPFMGDVVKEKTELITEVGNYKFKTNGSVIKDKGWSEYVPEYSSKDQTLPEMNEGDDVSFESFDLNEGKTKPPKRYDVETLLSVLKNIHKLIDDTESKEAIKKAEGLGRPSTRSKIIEDLIKEKAITCKGRKQEFTATDLGIEIIEKLKNNPITSPQLRATWETKLQDLEKGKITFNKLYDDIVKYTKYICETLEKLDFSLENSTSNEKKHIAILPNNSKVFESEKGFYDEKLLEYMSKKEEAIKNKEEEPDFYGLWIPKEFKNSSFEMKGKFNKKDIKDLIEKGEIEKEFHWISKNYNSNAKLKLNDENKLEFVKSNSNYKTKEISDGILMFEGNEKIFYKLEKHNTICSSIIAGHTMTIKELEELNKNSEVYINDFKSKSGSTFSAYLIIKDNKTSFDFSKRK